MKIAKIIIAVSQKQWKMVWKKTATKPCVIGTKIATKVLKDGDMVEVDAEKGTVIIIT